MPANVLDPKPIQILQVTRDLLAQRERWIKHVGYGLRFSRGGALGLRIITARCAQHATRVAAANLRLGESAAYDAAQEALLKVVVARGAASIPAYYDRKTTTHAMILGAIDEAIARLRDPDNFRPHPFALVYFVLSSRTNTRTYRYSAAAR